MTVTYTHDVTTAQSLGTFLKLLFRWRASIIKLVVWDLLLFMVLFYILNFVYRFALDDEQRRLFEVVSVFFDQNSNLIPVAFILGFYVMLVVTRWWKLLMTIPWPNRMAIFVTSYIKGKEERGRLMRRTVMRYFSLAFVLMLRNVSPCIKKRFPTLQEVVGSGLLTEDEKTVYENIKTQQPKFFLPLVWATSIVNRARKENKVRSDIAVQTLLHEIHNFQHGLLAVFNSDWITIPLIYTQVTTLSVYTFFLACIMGRQLLDPRHPEVTGHFIDTYVPLYTILQFLFYVGWLKVAECLLNPFGEDDDDFDVNEILDCGFEDSLLMVDELHSEIPDLEKDMFWDEVEFELPYTQAAEKFKRDPYRGSAFDVVVAPGDAQVAFSPSQQSLSSSSSTGKLRRMFSRTRSRSRHKSTTSHCSSVPSSQQGSVANLKTDQEPSIDAMSNHSPKLVKSEPTAPPTVRFAGNFGDEDSDEEPSPGNAVENTDESHDVFSAKLDRQISTINPNPVKDESTTLLTPPPDIIVTTPRTSESLAKNFLTIQEVQQKCATNVNDSNAQNVVNGEVCLENEQYPNEEASTKSVSLTSENEQFITDSDKVNVKYYSKSPTKDVLDTSENEPLIGYSDTSVTEDTTLASTSESLSECDQSESTALI